MSNFLKRLRKVTGCRLRLEVGAWSIWEQTERGRESGELHLEARRCQPGQEGEVGSFFVS